MQNKILGLVGLVILFGFTACPAQAMLECKFNTVNVDWILETESSPAVIIYASDDQKNETPALTLTYKTYQERNEALNYCNSIVDDFQCGEREHKDDSGKLAYVDYFAFNKALKTDIKYNRANSFRQCSGMSAGLLADYLDKKVGSERTFNE